MSHTPDLQSSAWRKWLLCLSLLAALSALLSACSIADESDVSSGGPLPESVFESDDPTNPTSGYGGGATADAGVGTGGSGGSSGSGGSAGAAGGSGGGGGNAGSGGNEAEAAIEEADVIQLKGNTLYALSRFSGINVIDVSIKDQLKLLGNKRFDGVPFEMYVRDDVVFAMFSSLTKVVYSSSGQKLEQTGSLIALDVSSPAQIEVLGEFVVPGEISDSRLIGNLLYVVSYESGYCYGCAGPPRTTVISLDVSAPANPKKIAELSLSGDSYGHGKRSVAVMGSRMYIGGPEWGGTSNGSEIQIVDISDPSGKLVQGAKFPVAGQIESRWQMDEKDGVLRVISQPPSWDAAPKVQTFQISSASEVVPLGSLDMILPEPERLRSVRFDGTRAYAITFRQTDPLFTIDLSDPAAPKQLGELEIPGWVYHMEPRGDRLLALGFDQTNPDGALHVSLFDVGDMTNPKLLDRVPFGGHWGSFAEDQDRIHKAFTILDALGLIFVPFSGYQHDNPYGEGCGSYTSGIKIVEFSKDDLVGRGVAPSQGSARRAFLHQDRLFAVSDVSVETFDIGNRDAPIKKANVEISMNVSQTIQVGDKVARLGENYWSRRATLDVTTLDQVELPNPAGSFEFTVSDGYKCWYDWYGTRLFANGSRLYVLESRSLFAFDLAGDVPVLLGKITIPEPFETSYPDYYSHEHWYAGPTLLEVGSSAVNVGDVLVVQRHYWRYLDSGKQEQSTWLTTIDASNPKFPAITLSQRPESIGFNALHVAGGSVVSTRWIPSPTTPGKVRFYLDRLDVSNGAAPKWLEPINVPGSLLAIAADGKRAITADYEKQIEDGRTMQECYEKWNYTGLFEPKVSGHVEGKCIGFQRHARLVEIESDQATLRDSRLLPTRASAYDAHAGDDRVYLPLMGWYGQPHYGYSAVIVSGVNADELALNELSVPLDSSSYISQTLALGKRLFLLNGHPASIIVVDTNDPAAPAVGAAVSLDGYSPASVSVIGDQAVCSLGERGVKSISLAN